MRKADSPPVKWGHVALFLTALLVATADQLSKTWIRSYPQGYLIHKVGFLQIIHIRNTGSVFGVFQGQSFALTIVALMGVAVLLFLAFYAYRRFPPLTNMPTRIALGLILGGTVGNLVDRLRFVFDSTAGNLVERLNQGFVTDFIDVGFWPVFNIADSAIVIGVIIIAYSLLRLAITEEHRGEKTTKS